MALSLAKAAFAAMPDVLIDTGFGSALLARFGWDGFLGTGYERWSLAKFLLVPTIPVPMRVVALARHRARLGDYARSSRSWSDESP